ncbi:MAG: AraC family transcriptional regulator, partial [Anaerolineaceae bacterium]
MKYQLEVFSDLSERLRYNQNDFPLYVNKGKLEQFDRYAASLHWHHDIEFILILEGSMDYYINGQIVTIHEGEGIFVNSKRLHYGFSTECKNCIFIVVGIHPSLFSEHVSFVHNYWSVKFGKEAEDFILLSRKTPYQSEVLDLINRIYESMHQQNPNPFQLLSEASKLCLYISDNISVSDQEASDGWTWLTLAKMTGFIQSQYENKITLEDIAAAGAVCRSRCCSLFSQYIAQTPINYLKHYRLQKSCEMLRDTNRSINEIALSCGFQSTSYFSYTFKKELNMMPKEYRKQFL